MASGDRAATSILPCAVIGLGGLGSAVLLALARLGVAATGFDRFSPPHDRGSSHGETRITRLAVGEGDAYVALVRRSHALWRDLELETGARLMQQTGLLLLGTAGGTMHGRSDFLGTTRSLLLRHGIHFDEHSRSESAERFPQFVLGSAEQAIFDPSGGMLFPEACISAMHSAARDRGAVLRLNERVLALVPEGDLVKITTDQGSMLARSVVVTAGPWVSEFSGVEIGARTRTTRQTLHWFETKAEAAFAPERCPVFIWIHGSDEEDSFYGFPALPGSGAVKIGCERYGQSFDPETADRFVADAESRDVHARHIVGRMPELTAATRRTAACIYTDTPDRNFIVDRVPGQPNIMVASACSGHGFKHTAGLGEAIAQTVVSGRSDSDLQAFSLDRFAINAPV